ncbi:hypothetical protein ABD96_20490 [Bacillus cereus]|nr:hypothetical protein [Bacillus cereus]
MVLGLINLSVLYTLFKKRSADCDFVTGIDMDNDGAEEWPCQKPRYMCKRGVLCSRGSGKL